MSRSKKPAADAVETSAVEPATITMLNDEVTDHGQWRSAGHVMTVGVDISAARALCLIDEERAVLTDGSPAIEVDGVTPATNEGESA